MSNDFKRLIVNGEDQEPGSKVKLREHMTAEDIDHIVRAKREEQKQKASDDG